MTVLEHNTMGVCSSVPAPDGVLDPAQWTSVRGCLSIAISQVCRMHPLWDHAVQSDLFLFQILELSPFEFEHKYALQYTADKPFHTVLSESEHADHHAVLATLEKAYAAGLACWIWRHRGAAYVSNTVPFASVKLPREPGWHLQLMCLVPPDELIRVHVGTRLRRMHVEERRRKEQERREETARQRQALFNAVKQQLQQQLR